MNRGTGSDSWVTRRDSECAELLAVMEEQKQLCQLLLELSQGERSALVDGRVEELERAATEKSGLVAEMELLEGKRRSLSGEMASRLGLPRETTLLDLAAKLEPEDSSRLLEIRVHVADVYSSLRTNNDGNLQLMRKSLDLVRDSLRQLRRATGAGDSYTSAGKPALNINNNMAVDCTA